MKQILCITALFLCFLFAPKHSQAQSNEAMQLVLNWQKLQQLRKILTNMYKGYQILTKGYQTVKQVSEGNFRLHQVFLDGLLEVNPRIKDYHRVIQIIQHQQLLLQEYKNAWGYFKNDSSFTPEEIDYIQKVYNGLFQRSMKDLDELIMVTTAAKLRMDDDERMQTIDRIFANMEDKLAFLRYFNSSTMVLSAQRTKAGHEANTLQKVYDLH